jgi:hypothetical protein
MSRAAAAPPISIPPLDPIDMGVDLHDTATSEFADPYFRTPLILWKINRFRVLSVSNQHEKYTSTCEEWTDLGKVDSIQLGKASGEVTPEIPKYQALREGFKIPEPLSKQFTIIVTLIEPVPDDIGVWKGKRVFRFDPGAFQHSSKQTSLGNVPSPQNKSNQKTWMEWMQKMRSTGKAAKDLGFSNFKSLGAELQVTRRTMMTLVALNQWICPEEVMWKNHKEHCLGPQTAAAAGAVPLAADAAAAAPAAAAASPAATPAAAAASPAATPAAAAKLLTAKQAKEQKQKESDEEEGDIEMAEDDVVEATEVSASQHSAKGSIAKVSASRHSGKGATLKDAISVEDEEEQVPASAVAGAAALAAAAEPSEHAEENPTQSYRNWLDKRLNLVPRPRKDILSSLLTPSEKARKSSINEACEQIESTGSAVKKKRGSKKTLDADWSSAFKGPSTKGTSPLKEPAEKRAISSVKTPEQEAAEKAAEESDVMEQQKVEAASKKEHALKLAQQEKSTQERQEKDRQQDLYRKHRLAISAKYGDMQVGEKLASGIEITWDMFASIILKEELEQFHVPSENLHVSLDKLRYGVPTTAERQMSELPADSKSTMLACRDLDRKHVQKLKELMMTNHFAQSKLIVACKWLNKDQDLSKLTKDKVITDKDLEHWWAKGWLSAPECVDGHHRCVACKELITETEKPQGDKKKSTAAYGWNEWDASYYIFPSVDGTAKWTAHEIELLQRMGSETNIANAAGMTMTFQDKFTQTRLMWECAMKECGVDPKLIKEKCRVVSVKE